MLKKSLLYYAVAESLEKLLSAASRKTDVLKKMDLSVKDLQKRFMPDQQC